MCDPVAVPQSVGCELSQKKLPERLNSSASVSDLSEAASDMSLSTSPGSDMPLQQSKGTVSTFPASEHEISSHAQPQTCSNKKPLVRKLSSNPYPTSSDMSPNEDHLQLIGTRSYTAGENRLYEKMEDIANVSFSELYNRASYMTSSNTVASDCPDESDEDDDEGDDSSNDEKQKGEITLEYSQENKDGIKNISPVSGCQRQVESSPHQPYTEVFSPELSPGTLTISPELTQTRHHNNYQLQQHNEQQYNNNNIHNLHKQQFFRNLDLHSGRSNSGPENVLANKINGYKCNENEIYSLRNEPHEYTNTCDELLHQGSVLVSDPPKSREINSWGHFHKSSESNYRYRRSHYSSDSDEEDTPGNSKPNQKQTSSSLSAYKSQLDHCDRSSPSQSPSVHRTTVHRNQVGSSTERQVWAHNGIKPQEFKERFLLMKQWFSECNDGQKNLVMKGLLSLCELPQLHLLSVHMSKELHQGCPSNCEDIITWLPRDLALKVMSYLDPVSLCHAAQVCRVWRQLAEDQSLWCRFCCQTKWRLSKAAEHKQVISHMCPEGSIQWKNVFAERFRLRNNWLKGRCTVRTFEGHMQGISCVQFDDSRIVSGSSDKTIKVWNMRTNAPWSVQTLMGHHGTVRCLYLEGNRLVSGSCDKTIKVWDLSTQESWSSIACKVTMTGHTDTVRCLQADDDKVISGSYDTTLKIWDLKSGALRRTLRGHQASVLCVHFSETKIVSGSADKTIKVWNYEGNCMMTLRGHQDAVTCLMFDSTRIVSGSLDHNLKFWDIHTGECLNTIDWKKAEGHTDVVRCLQADSWRVVSAADDKTIKVWNLATGERLVTLRNHTDGVTCLQFNDFIIVSGSYDKSVKLWDFSCC